jgi:hypothetical protein
MTKKTRAGGAARLAVRRDARLEELQSKTFRCNHSFADENST